MDFKELEQSITKKLFSKTTPKIFKEPFPHIIIDDFFPKDFFKLLHKANVNMKDIKKSFKRAAIKAGLPKAHPHTLRHSAAVWMAQAGNDMEEIRQYLGQRRIDVTRNIYARYSPSYLQKAAKSLEL